MPREGTPAFTGLIFCEDRKWGYDFWYPVDWHRFELPPDRFGVLVGPDPIDPATSFSIETRDLGTEITESDMPALYEGFVDGIRALPGCSIEKQEHWVAGKLIGLEATYTFREGPATRKRWVRLLYEGRRQLHAVAQGATEDEYTYWLPMLFEAMGTLRIH